MFDEENISFFSLPFTVVEHLALLSMIWSLNNIMKLDIEYISSDNNVELFIRPATHEQN